MQAELQLRARNLCGRISGSESAFEPLIFLKTHVANWAHTFQVITGVAPQRRFSEGATNDFYLDRQEAIIYVSPDFLKNWETLSRRMLFATFERNPLLQGLEVLDVWELFLLHEFCHFEQQLTAERHSDIRQAQSVLRSIDYHADMLAVLLHTNLAGIAPGALYGEKARTAFCRATYAALLAARVFNPFTKDQLAMSPNRLRRMFLLYLQHFRSSLGQWSDPAQLQLLFEPAIDFRNITPIRLKDNQVRHDVFITLFQERTETTAIWVTYPARYLTPRVLRLSDAAASPLSIAGALAAMFFDVDSLDDNYSAAKTVFDFFKDDAGGILLFEPEQAFKPLVRYAIRAPRDRRDAE